MDERRKHGWPFWIVAALIAPPVLYVGSFGPACWSVAPSDQDGIASLTRFYAPVLRAARWTGWEWPQNLLAAYGGKSTQWVFLMSMIQDTIVIDHSFDSETASTSSASRDSADATP